MEALAKPPVLQTARIRAGLVRVATVLGILLTLQLGLTVGAVPVPMSRSLSILANALLGQWDSTDTMTIILLEIRLPRLLLGLMVGAALATAGVLMQGIFRNALADPSLVGVSSGASLGAAIMIVSANAVAIEGLSGPWLVAVAAFIGGMTATTVVYRLSTQARQTRMSTMLLAGIAINALASAGVGFLQAVADDEQLRDLTFWILGSLSGATWSSVTVLVPFIVALIVAAPWLAASLDGLLLGEAEASHIGVSVERVKRVAIVLASAAVGASVAVSGTIFFIGLVVPHLFRLVWGPNHRRLLPGAAVLGAVLVVLADVVSRTVIAPAELPIGIMTALLGAPFFLFLLSKTHGEG